MKHNLLFGCLLCCLACASCKKTATTETSKANTPSIQLVGNDSDEHGCKASAGYTWSELKGECVRVWEVGQTIYYKKPQGNTVQGIFAIFSPDSTHIETYEVQHIIWERKEKLPIFENKVLNKTLTLTDSIYPLNDSVNFPIWVLE